MTVETTDFKFNSIVFCSRLSKIATNVYQIQWRIEHIHFLSFFFEPKRRCCTLMPSSALQGPCEWPSASYGLIISFSFILKNALSHFSVPRITCPSFDPCNSGKTAQQSNTSFNASEACHRTWLSLNNIPLSLNLMPDSLTVSAL